MQANNNNNNAENNGQEYPFTAAMRKQQKKESRQRISAKAHQFDAGTQTAIDAGIFG